MADVEFEEFKQIFEQHPQHIKAGSNCYKLAHDIALDSPSPEDKPQPPDPPGEVEKEKDNLDERLSKCCSSEDSSCPQLPPENVVSEVLNASTHPSFENPMCSPIVQARQKSNSPPKPNVTCLDKRASSDSPICGSPRPKAPLSELKFSTLSSGEDGSQEFEEDEIIGVEYDITEAEDEDDDDDDDDDDGDADNDEDEGEEEREITPDSCQNKLTAHFPAPKRQFDRKRRKLPEIPKNKKSFSSASILALRTPTLAEELQEAESGIASRSSTPDGFSLLTSHSRPVLVLKCHSYLRDDSCSPESDIRLPILDIDSGHSTQHSPDGIKSISPLAEMEVTPLSPGGGMPFPQYELLDATHRGLYRFIPRHGDEVEIEIGDAIYVQREAEDLWCEGVNLRTGRQGIFPAAHVTDVDYSEFDPTVNKVKKERYLLNYLGSIETLCHKGNQVLCQAVRKIARGETAAARVHSCILEVSDQGIRMVDKSRPAQNSLPCHDYFYHLKHVSFCGFHPKDPRYFGFITKHPAVQRFACHVFSSHDSTRPVAEAVGRSFQRFYYKYIETAYPTEDIYLE